MLSVGAHLSKRLELHSDPDDPSTSDIGFLLAAMQLVDGEINSSYPTTAIGLGWGCWEWE